MRSLFNFCGWISISDVLSLPIMHRVISSEILPMYIPTAPTQPRMLTIIGTPTGSTVELNWLPPLQPNGDIHYVIEYEPAMTPGDSVRMESNSLYFNLTLPNEFLSYNVTVAAVNSQIGANSNALLVMCSAAGRGKVYCKQLVYSQAKHSLITASPNPAWCLLFRSPPSDWCVRCCHW